MRIPKRIIQTGKSFDLPLLSRSAVANVRLLNPDFEYLFFDDKQVEDFIDNEFPEYRGIFNSFRFPISRYDFFRYLAIYRLGGFYFDLDVFLANGLKTLLEFGCVFPFEELTLNKFLREQCGMDWEIGNYAFGASAGHPFIYAVILNCIRAQREPRWAEPMMRSIPAVFRDYFYVLYTTGPGLVSRTLAEYPGASSQVKVLFPKDVNDRKKWGCFGEFGVHLMEGTWFGSTSDLRRRLFALWMSWKRKKLCKKQRKLGAGRSLEFTEKA